MNKKNLLIVGVIVAVVMVGWLAGFFGNSSTDTEVSEEQSQQAIDDQTNDMTVKTDQGTWSTSDKLPADFPKDAPVYPGATVEGSLAAGQSAEQGYYAGFQTKAAVADVAAWYKSEIAQQGWNIQSNASVNGATMMSGEKGDRILTVTISSESGVTTIALVVAKK